MTSSPTRTRPDDYSLGADDAERTRLLAQCAMHRAEAVALLDGIGLGAGGQALRTWAAARWVCSTCSPTGSGRPGGWWASTGSPDSWPWPPARCASAGRAGSHSWTPTPPAPGCPVTRSTWCTQRLVLNNVPRPGEVVAEMVRLTRPGGHVAVQDVDWLSWTCAPAHPAWDRLTAVAAAAWSGDVCIGRRLPALLRAAGLVDVRVEAHIRIHRPGQPYHRLLLRFLDIHRDRILDAGALTAAELDR